MGWSGGLAEWEEIDGTICLSIAFSWRLQDAWQRAVFHRTQGKAVRVGGPAVWVQRHYFDGLAEFHPDADALIHHNAEATVASRGCPVGCYFCVVPTMEGRTFTLLPDFVPRPILCDNNLSALSVEYQEYIIHKYKCLAVELHDANSGFEPMSFDGGTYERWRVILRGPWRFAFDEMREHDAVRRMMTILQGESPRRKRVYVLIGNEPVQTCLERVTKVIEWGGEPYCQPLLPFNAPRRDSYKILHDWTPQTLRDFARWANRFLWRSVPWLEYLGPVKTQQIDLRQLHFEPNTTTDSPAQFSPGVAATITAAK